MNDIIVPSGIRTWDLSIFLYLNLNHGDLDQPATKASPTVYSCPQNCSLSFIENFRVYCEEKGLIDTPVSKEKLQKNGQTLNTTLVQKQVQSKPITRYDSHLQLVGPFLNNENFRRSMQDMHTFQDEYAESADFSG